MPSTRVIAFLLSCALVTILACVRGGAPEKGVAAMFASIVFFDAFAHAGHMTGGNRIDLLHLGLDAIAWVGFVGIALYAHRIWPLVITSFQTIALASHVAPLLSVSIDPVVYVIMQVAASYPVLVLLVIGTLRHQRRLQLFGHDPCWSVGSNAPVVGR